MADHTEIAESFAAPGTGLAAGGGRPPA